MEGCHTERHQGRCSLRYGIRDVTVRTQLFNAMDIENVRKIQDGYKVQTLSAYLGKPAPAAAPPIHWPKLTEDMTKTSALFPYLNFLLQFCPTLPSEQSLMSRFAKLNIGAGKTFDYEKLSADSKKDIDGGVADAWEELTAMMKRVNAGDLTGTGERGHHCADGNRSNR